MLKLLSLLAFVAAASSIANAELGAVSRATIVAKTVNAETREYQRQLDCAMDAACTDATTMPEASEPQ